MTLTRERVHCRRCEYSSFGVRQRRSFVLPGSKPHYAPDLPFRVEHIKLELTVDPKKNIASGSVTHRVKVIMAGQKHLRLDQIGLSIEAVEVAGKSAAFRIDGDKLIIDIGESKSGAFGAGEVFEFTVKYAAVNPRRGLYFTGPDASYPDKPYQVWSQGQDEDSRYWFPTFDYPNQKATSEVIAVVPKGFTAVSNGALLAKKDTPHGTQYHYKLGMPHVTYLISLVVGEFAEIAEKGPRGLPVQYFMAPGREEDAKRAFGNTPKMIEAFEKRTGVPFPYEKYSQVAVQDFIFGGMENTSATTQTELTLHDARAHLDFSSDPLVSHELAHQWFGDLVTCRDWSHGWLNEGFATFMERVWIENYSGPGGGFDEAKYYSYQDLKDHFEEDQGRYRRPIVCNTYLEPIDLFDTHLYQKGGLVLNLIRHVLGEESFWQSVNHYLNKHRGQNVETLDLIRAIEETTGRNLRRLFDEWVFMAGYPVFEVSYQWHEEKKLAELVIEQKQTGGKPVLVEDGAMTPIFHLPVVIELTFEGGRKSSHCIEIGEARERVFLPAEQKPLMVRFDPDHGIPKKLKFPRPKEMLLYQLAKDADCMGRIEAAKELAKFAEREVVEALGKSAAGDSFWGVQAEAAMVLSEIRMDAARDALISALGTKDHRARRAIAIALGTFKDPAAAAALKKLAEKDDSYHVEGDATFAWSEARNRPIPVPQTKDLEETESFLISQLSKTSHREVIRGAALRGLAELQGIGRGERPRALATLMEWTRAGHPMDARTRATIALGSVARTAIASERARILELFALLAEEENFRLRMALLVAIGDACTADAIPILEKISALELDGRVRRNAMTLIDSLRTAGETPESVATLKAALEKLEHEQRGLRGWVEELRAKKG